jgi:hypothetical protein
MKITGGQLTKTKFIAKPQEVAKDFLWLKSQKLTVKENEYRKRVTTKSKRLLRFQIA